jgi:hypothetical protein
MPVAGAQVFRDVTVKKCHNRTKLRWPLANGLFLSHKLLITAIVVMSGMRAGSLPAGGGHGAV